MVTKDDGYLLRHLLRKIERRESAYSGSEDFVMMRADYACSGSEAKVTKVYLVKGYFQDEAKGCEALARTQVYLSKTKLKLQVGI